MNSRPFLLRSVRILFVSSALFFAAVLPVSAQIVPCSGVACGLCDFLKLFQAIMRFLLLISIPLASVLFAYAGFLYFSSAGDEGKLEKAKQIFIDVAIGFILALSAWLIIETILRATLNSTYFSGWNTIQCVEGGRPGASLNGQSSAGTGTKSVTVGPNPVSPTGPQAGSGSCQNGCTTVADKFTLAPGFSICTGSIATCAMDKNTVDRLQIARELLRDSGLEMGLTVAGVPDSEHQDPCHKNGNLTCADSAIYPWNSSTKTVSSFTPLTDATTVAKAASAYQSAGLLAVWEVADKTRADTLIASGVSCKNVLVVSGIKEHFSVYRENDGLGTRRNSC